MCTGFESRAARTVDDIFVLQSENAWRTKNARNIYTNRFYYIKYCVFGAGVAFLKLVMCTGRVVNRIYTAKHARQNAP